MKTKIKNGNTISKLLKKFSVFVDIRNNAFLLSGSSERIFTLWLYSKVVLFHLFFHDMPIKFLKKFVHVSNINVNINMKICVK